MRSVLIIFGLIFGVTLSIQSCKLGSTRHSDDGCTPKTITPDTTIYPVLTLKSPLGCETFFLGDSILISWQYFNQDRGLMTFFYSLNGGLTFENMFPKNIFQQIPESDTLWGIPDSMKFVSDSVIIKIRDYGGGYGEESLPFSIKQK